jgi:hypothetical protein
MASGIKSAGEPNNAEDDTITEPGSGAGDECDRMVHGRLRGEGRVVRPREARVGLLITNYSVIYW